MLGTMTPLFGLEQVKFCWTAHHCGHQESQTMDPMMTVSSCTRVMGSCTTTSVQCHSALYVSLSKSGIPDTRKATFH